MDTIIHNLKDVPALTEKYVKAELRKYNGKVYRHNANVERDVEHQRNTGEERFTTAIPMEYISLESVLNQLEDMDIPVERSNLGDIRRQIDRDARIDDKKKKQATQRGKIIREEDIQKRSTSEIRKQLEQSDIDNIINHALQMTWTNIPDIGSTIGTVREKYAMMRRSKENTDEIIFLRDYIPLMQKINTSIYDGYAYMTPEQHDLLTRRNNRD